MSHIALSQFVYGTLQVFQRVTQGPSVALILALTPTTSHLILRSICSKVPMSSLVPVFICNTGRIMRAA